MPLPELSLKPPRSAREGRALQKGQQTKAAIVDAALGLATLGRPARLVPEGSVAASQPSRGHPGRFVRQLTEGIGIEQPRAQQASRFAGVGQKLPPGGRPQEGMPVMESA
jgi:hypothetical protein